MADNQYYSNQRRDFRQNNAQSPSSGQNGDRPSGYRQSGDRRPGFRQGGGAPQIPEEILPLPLPEDYVDAAEAVIRKLAANSKKITTSKIRNLFSLVTDIYNEENLRDDPQLKSESISALTMMRIRFVYEAGRDPQAVKDFVTEAKLLEYIKDIGTSREKLINFAHYMEALVAYHRYLIGGREG